VCDKFVLVVKPDATIVALYDDALLPLMHQGETSTRRASHVEPSPAGTEWEADLSPVGGPLLTGFSTRAAALAAERAYIETNVLTGTAA
jgi:hypothetical protein